MGWLQLFKNKSIEEGLKPTVSKLGLRIDPKINGFNKKRLRYLFNIADIPFPYKKSDLIGNPLNPVHTFQKKILNKEEKYINKVIKVRAGIQNAIDKTDKYRQEREDKKPPKHLARMMIDSMPYLSGKSVSAITIVKNTDELEETIITTPEKRKSNVNASIYTKGVNDMRVSRKEKELAKFYMEAGIFNVKENKKNKGTSKTKKTASSALNDLKSAKKEYTNSKKV